MNPSEKRIIALVKARIIPGKQAQLRTIANILQYDYAPTEEGCEQYESFIDGDTFITLGRWADQACLDQHLKAAHVALYVPQMKTCVEGGVFEVQLIKTDDCRLMHL